MNDTLHKYLHKFKPGVSRKIHLLLAALLWSVIGIFLMLRGCVWLIGEENFVYILPSLLLGSLKSLFILDKSAKKSIDRIQRMADRSCLGAVYSIKTWLLVFVMMSGGYLLRNSSISLVIVGSLYVTIGWALLFSSRLGWSAWRKTH